MKTIKEILNESIEQENALYPVLAKLIETVSEDSIQFEQKLDELIGEYEAKKRIAEKLDYLKTL